MVNEIPKRRRGYQMNSCDIDTEYIGISSSKAEAGRGYPAWTAASGRSQWRSSCICGEPKFP